MAEAAEIKNLKDQLKKLKIENDGLKTGNGVHEQPKVVYLASERKIGRFSGDPKQMPLDEWISDVEAYVTSHALSGDSAYHFIRQHLMGSAKIEVEGRKSLKTKEEIFETLQTVFNETGNIHQRRQNFYKRKQGPRESILDFSHDLIKLYHDIELLDSETKDSGEVLKTQLAEGVSDSGLRRELYRRLSEVKKEDFFDLRDWAIEWERRGQRVGHRYEGSRDVNIHEAQASDTEVVGLKKQLDALEAKFNQQEENNKCMKTQLDAILQAVRGRDEPQPNRGPPRRTNFRCYGCGSPDHPISRCPDRVRRDGDNSYVGRQNNTQNNTQAGTQNSLNH